MKDYDYIFIIENDDFKEDYLSDFIGINYNIRGCGMEVPNDKPLPSVEVAKPPTQNWSKRKNSKFTNHQKQI